MSIRSSRSVTWLLATAAAGACAAMLAASSASAQTYDRYDDNGYRDTSEGVIVTAPHRLHQRSTIGAPIDRFRVSEAVPIDDLNLRTRWGEHLLRARILMAARRVCDRLNDSVYPDFVTPPTTDSPPCVRTAISRAMYQADAAIAEARETASRE